MTASQNAQLAAEIDALLNGNSTFPHQRVTLTRAQAIAARDALRAQPSREEVIEECAIRADRRRNHALADELRALKRTDATKEQP